MYIETVPNRNSPPAVLLRESWWDKDAKRSRKRTLANLSKLSPSVIANLKACLQGASVQTLPEAMTIPASWPHGHVAAALGMLRQLGLETLIAARRSRQRDRVTARIVARILDPQAKLATAPGLSPDSHTSSLGPMLDLGPTEADELYAAMDWLGARQERIETRLARRHLADGALVLWDLTSVWMEGRQCDLAAYGYSRDGKKGKMPIEFGLLCDREGRPVAVEVFDGHTSDPASVSTAVRRVRDRFGLTRVVIVGDRGMLTEARIRDDIEPAGLDWIGALRAPAIRKLVANDTLQPSLLDERDLAEITCEELFPGERLIVCRNPLLADERRRKRQALLDATEEAIRRVEAATRRPNRRLRGIAAITRRLEPILIRHKMRKHFTFTIQDDGFTGRRKAESIAEEEALDGIYVVRTSLPETVMDADETVRSYKRLASVERAFRSLKTVDLKVRPVYHRRAHRVRAHVLLCMLAYYVEWHMRAAWQSLLFHDDGPPTRASVVAPATPSSQARRKAATRRTPEGLPVLRFADLLKHLATLTRIRLQPTAGSDVTVDMTTTLLQKRAFELLGVRLP